MKRVSAKLGNMRKPQDFIVLPVKRGDDPLLMIQSDKSIGIFNYRTGEGRLNTKGCYSPHLAMAKPFNFPMDFVAACLEAAPSLGGATQVSPALIVSNTVQVIG